MQDEKAFDALCLTFDADVAEKFLDLSIAGKVSRSNDNHPLEILLTLAKKVAREQPVENTSGVQGERHKPSPFALLWLKNRLRPDVAGYSVTNPSQAAATFYRTEMHNHLPHSFLASLKERIGLPKETSEIIAQVSTASPSGSKYLITGEPFPVGSIGRVIVGIWENREGSPRPAQLLWFGMPTGPGTIYMTVLTRFHPGSAHPSAASLTIDMPKAAKDRLLFHRLGVVWNDKEPIEAYAYTPSERFQFLIGGSITSTVQQKQERDHLRDLVHASFIWKHLDTAPLLASGPAYVERVIATTIGIAPNLSKKRHTMTVAPEEALRTISQILLTSRVTA